ncbi:hypothetical protein Cenrod_1158 [Candidatus Symbiobacter mobilis CR]|uniref:Uncharacterized protein n=1 Tax=Candidatus Symbiobacter mobilis CR TaxID=946483 RepID=U5N6T6_9BURK|nr:hypothetical protein Cenrod_1158 [Candidatus Symbiobacter mobilis CR]
MSQYIVFYINFLLPPSHFWEKGRTAHPAPIEWNWSGKPLHADVRSGAAPAPLPLSLPLAP